MAVRKMETGVGFEHCELTFDPGAFSALRRVCQVALAQSHKNPEARKPVVQLKIKLQKLSREQLGYDCADVYLLSSLINQTCEAPKQNRKTPIETLIEQGKLTARQMEAVEYIQMVWNAFRRFLFFQNRDIAKVGRVRAHRTLEPLDSMTKTEAEEWEGNYRAWFEKARSKKIGTTTRAQLVFDVVLYDIPLRDIERVHGLKKGTALRILRAELNAY